MQNTLCAVYGVVVGVITTGDLSEKMALYTNVVQLGSGLSVGLCGLAAGIAIGVVGDAGVRASTQRPRLYFGMAPILIFSEVLARYGVIVSILMLTCARLGATECRY